MHAFATRFTPTPSTAPLRRAPLAALLLLLALPATLSAETFAVNDANDHVDALPGDGRCETSNLGCTLRAAVMEANALPGPDTILLTSGTVYLSIPGALGDSDFEGAVGDLDVTDDLTISSSQSFTIIQTHVDFIFEVHASLHLSGVTVQGGWAGIVNYGQLKLDGAEIRSASAFGLWSRGKVDITDSTLRQNDYAISNEGVLHVTRSSIRDNQLGIANGPTGAIDAYEVDVASNVGDGGISNQGYLVLRNSSLRANEGPVGGLETLSNARSSLSNVSVFDNRSDATGAGVHGSGLTWLFYSTVIGNLICDQIDGCQTQDLKGSGINVQSSYVQSCGYPAPHNQGGNVEPFASCPFTLPSDQQYQAVTFTPTVGNPAVALVPATNLGALADRTLDNDCPLVDQQGGARPTGASCDVGAVEIASVPACSDGLDNDGDSLVDGADPGCADPSDPQEFELAAGDLVVTNDDEDGAETIERIDPNSGARELLARGHGLVLPLELGLDADGSLVVSDLHFGLFSVDPGTGIPRLITAGDLLDRMNGFAIESSGQIVVTSFQNDRVVRVDPNTGAQTVIASGASFDGVAHVEIDPLDGTMLVWSLGGSPRPITRLAASGQVLATYQTGVWSPGAAVFDANGDLLQLDNGKLLRHDFAADTHTVAVNSLRGLDIARESSGDLIVTDDFEIVRVSLGSQPVVTTLTTSLEFPRSVVVVPGEALADDQVLIESNRTAMGTLRSDWVTVVTGSPEIDCPGSFDLCTGNHPGAGGYFDVEADSLTMQISPNLGTSYYVNDTFNGYIFSDLDPGAPIDSITLVTDIAGLDASDVTFTDDEVAVNLSGLAVDGGDFFTVYLPEPGRGLQLAAGLALLLGLSRGRRERKIAGGGGRPAGWLVLALGLLAAAPAGARIFQVDTIVDSQDVSPGDASCADAANACSLRAAVMEANALAGADRIDLPAGYYRLTAPTTETFLGIDDSQGDLDILGDLEIHGVGSGSDVTLNTVVGCASYAFSAIAPESGSTSLRGIRWTACSTAASNSAVLTLDDVAFVENIGAIVNDGRLEGRELLFERNNVGFANEATGTASLDRVTFRDGWPGTAVGNSGALQLVNSAVYGNLVSCIRAAISNSGRLEVANVSVFGNVGENNCQSDPPAIENTGTTRLVNATVNGGLENSTSSALFVLNSYVEGGCVGPVGSLGHNIENGTSCGFTAAGDQQNVSAFFVLDTNGPTATLVPQIATAFRDRGDNIGCALTDQRGLARPSGASCDIGAAEIGAAHACNDGQDNDGDGLYDLADPGCSDASDPLELTLSPGDILVAETGNRAVAHVDPASGATHLLSRGLGLDSPFGLTRDVRGALWVADSANALFRMDPDTGFPTLISAGGLLILPRGVDVETDGSLVIADRGDGRVVRVDPDTGIQTLVASGAAFSVLEGMLFDPADGTLLVTEIASGAGQGIKRIHPGSGVVVGAYTGGLFSDPRSVIFAANGDLLAADDGANLVVRIDPVSGQQSLVASGLDAWGLALESNGQVIASLRGPGQVVRVDPATGGTTTLANGLLSPRHVEVLPEPGVAASLFCGALLLAGLRRGSVRPARSTRM